MRCFYCNKNEAVKSYERIKQTKKREYYCLECYERLFFSAKAETDFSVCPYCGTSVEEFQSKKLVGCPYCYRTMNTVALAMIEKMQNGVCGHRGKKPPLSEEDESTFLQMHFASDAEKDAFRKEMEAQASFERQKKELETLSAYLKGQNSEREAGYREKLERMSLTGEIEEEIVW